MNVTVGTPGITVTPITGLSTKESGRSASFEVVLDSRPTAEVTIELTSLDTTEGRLDRDRLVFNQDNWDVAQVVRVRGVDDHIRDGNVKYTVQVGAAVSDDSNYNGLDGDDVEITNRDNERGRKGRGFDGGNEGGAAGSSGSGDSGGKDSAPGKIKKSVTASKIADFGSSLRGFLSALTGIDQESGSTAKDHVVADIGEDGLRGSVHQAVELLFEATARQ